MSSQVIRVPNGGSIQVRSGVLRGIGPAGPVGPVGPQGPQGDQGNQGDTGATGSINDFRSKFHSTGTTGVGPNTDTILPLDAVDQDDLNAFLSSTAFQILQMGNYIIYVDVTFTKGTPDSIGGRSVSINITAPTAANGTTMSVGSNPKADTRLVIAHAALFQAGTVLQLSVRHSDTISLAIGQAQMKIYRIGAGPQGAQGIQGPVGALGPQGIQGPQGPQGNAGSGFATYEDLR